MEKFELDVSKWRCGMGNSINLGEAPTKLLNERGYQCCLGLYATHKGIPNALILNLSLPNIAYITSEHEYSQLMEKDVDGSTFSTRAMHINDELDTTWQEKLSLLKTLFLTQDIDLVTINLPIQEEKSNDNSK